MATQTSNLGLTKPAYDEAADIVPAVNNNMDTLDSKIGAVPANSSVQGQLDSHTQAIATLSDQIGSLFAYKEFTTTLGTMSAYYQKTGNINGIAVTGYQPFAIRSYELNEDHMILNALNLTSTYAYYSVKNYDSSTYNDVTLKVRIAYVKVGTVTELT